MGVSSAGATLGWPGAALIGLILLGEVLGAVKWLAIACVVVAGAGAARQAQTPSLSQHAAGA